MVYYTFSLDWWLGRWNLPNAMHTHFNGWHLNNDGNIAYAF